LRKIKGVKRKNFKLFYHFFGFSAQKTPFICKTALKTDFYCF